MDIKPGTFLINGVVVFGASTLQVSHVGDVPPDRQEVLALAATVTRRIAESAHSECLAGLREIKARADAKEGGLGDMSPPPAECGALAEEASHALQARDPHRGPFRVHCRASRGV